MARPTKQSGPNRVYVFGGGLLLLLIGIIIAVRFFTTDECNVKFSFHEKYNGNIEVNKEVQFVNETQPAPTSVTWDFGDGNTSTEMNPVHIYTSEGTFRVVLTIDEGKCWSDTTITVMATSTEVLVVPQLPQAIIDGPTTAFVNEPITFYDRTPNLTTDKWAWGFQDTDDIVRDQNPTHTYKVAMKYTVTLDIPGYATAYHDIQILRKKDGPVPTPKGGGGAPVVQPVPAKPSLSAAQFVKAFQAEIDVKERKLAVNLIGSFFGGTFKDCSVVFPDGKRMKLIQVQNTIRTNKSADYFAPYNIDFKSQDGIINEVILKNK
jgi:hypothetical protein